MLATLYGVSISAINQHIKNVKVDNERAVQFRKWANQIVKDFTIKGWVMDDERLKNGETYMMDGKLYMNQHTYTQLKTSIEFENLLKR